MAESSPPPGSSLNGEPPDDALLALRARGGDLAAFGTLVERHHGRCLRYAERVLGSRADAEDAVQRAFVRAHRALGRYEERERFASWLIAVLANECRAFAREEKRRRAHEIVDDVAVGQAYAPEHPEPGQLDRVEAALRRLEPLLREAFLMRHVEELSYAEMVRATGAGESALKMRVKRACEALRAFLEDDSR